MKLKQCADTLMVKKTDNVNHETIIIMKKRKKRYKFELN